MPHQPQSPDQAAGPIPGLGYRLSRLFDIKRSKSGLPWSYTDAAAEINRTYRHSQLHALEAQLRSEGCDAQTIADRTAREPLRTVITPQYIGQLVSGEQNNPTVLRLSYLAAFLDVSPGFFFDETPEKAHLVDRQLEELALLVGSTELMALARHGSELSPKALSHVLRIVQTFREDPPE